MSPIRILLLMAVALLTACTTGLTKRESQSLRYEDYAGDVIQSFTLRNLDSWEPVSRNQLLLWNGPSEAYLVTVWKTCNSLQFANAVNVTSTSREVSQLEKVAVDGMHCPIESIRPVDIKAMREDRRAQDKHQAGAP